MTNKAKARPNDLRRQRFIPTLVCTHCGETAKHFMVRQCSHCGADVHGWCLIHHHVDYAGDADHPARDYSHLTPVA